MSLSETCIIRTNIIGQEKVVCCKYEINFENEVYCKEVIRVGLRSLGRRNIYTTSTRTVKKTPIEPLS